MLQLNNRHTID